MKLTEEQETYYHLKHNLTIRTMTLVADMSRDLVDFEKNLNDTLELHKTLKEVA